MQSKYIGGITINWGMEHRMGYCSICDALLVQNPKVTGKVDNNFCPNCNDYRLGRLICHSCRLNPPEVYEKASKRNIRLYLRRALMFVLLSKYNEYRIFYAESHRKKRIPEKYRSGENMPHTIKGAIWEIAKLKVRLCF